MEPMGVSTGSERELVERAAELMKIAPRLHGSLRQKTAEALAEAVAEMNCFYSNLIENETIRPADIRKAMTQDFSTDDRKRLLQLKAVAHIRASAWMRKATLNRDIRIFDAPFVKELHRRFIGDLPEEARFVEAEDGRRIENVPGAWREGSVTAGRHIPPDASELPGLMARFSEAYSKMRGPIERILDVGASHHRLVWIHPFLDGNGRVARLHSDAILIREGLNDAGLWSLSRGLARNSDRYKLLLSEADEPRRGDLDGRGALTHSGLAAFASFVVEQAIDQVSYMESLVRPGELRENLRAYLGWKRERHGMHPGAVPAMMAVLDNDELPRGAVVHATGLADSQGRTVLRSLLDDGLLRSDTEKGPVRLSFPVHALPMVLPDLYPGGTIDREEVAPRKRAAIKPKSRCSSITPATRTFSVSGQSSS